MPLVLLSLTPPSPSLLLGLASVITLGALISNSTEMLVRLIDFLYSVPELLKQLNFYLEEGTLVEEYILKNRVELLEWLRVIPVSRRPRGAFNDHLVAPGFQRDPPLADASLAHEHQEDARASAAC